MFFLKKINLLILFFAFVFSNCTPPPKKDSRPTVLVSIAPYAYFVEKIAQDTIKIETLVPSSVNPHVFEPTFQQVEAAYKAQIWFYIGDPFEQKILKVFQERNASTKCIDLRQGITLLSFDDAVDLGDTSCKSHTESKDSHVWLNPKMAEIQVNTIVTYLKELCPQYEAIYTERAEELTCELQRLDQQIRSLLAPVTQRAILTSHPAFGYFCKEYNLLQLSLECQGKDPLPQTVEKILEQTKKYSIHSILIQPQYNNKGAKLVAQKLHLPLYSVDPYARDYQKNLLYIASIIAQKPADNTLSKNK